MLDGDHAGAMPTKEDGVAGDSGRIVAGAPLPGALEVRKEGTGAP